MLLRTADPFRDLDRLNQQILGTRVRPAAEPRTIEIRHRPTEHAAIDS
jgi:hypothetical protein